MADDDHDSDMEALLDVMDEEEEAKKSDHQATDTLTVGGQATNHETMATTINKDDEADMEALLDVMDDEEAAKKSEEQKQDDVQLKYFQSLYDVFSHLDFTEINEDDDNVITLEELQHYIKRTNLPVPTFLAENLFNYIDEDSSGTITCMEYLKWRRNLTVESIAQLNSMDGVKRKVENETNHAHKPTASVLPDDIDLDDDELFGDTLKFIEDEDEKKQMDVMLKDMEKAAEAKRIAMEQKKKALEQEERKRKEYAEEQRRMKQEEERKLAEQRMQIEEERRQWEEQRQKEIREQKQKRLAELQNIVDDDGKVPSVGDEKGDDNSSGDENEESVSFEDSTDSEWDSDEDDDDAHRNRKTETVVEDNMCVKFFPCCKVFCCCCNTHKISRQTTRDLAEQKEKDITSVILSAKKRLSKFIFKYGDSYVDDGSMVTMLKQHHFKKYTKDVAMDDKMGVYFWSIVLDKLSQKAYDCLWPMLRYLGQELPTPVATELVHLYKVEMSRYPPAKIEGVTAEIVSNSTFGIATALVFAAYYGERAEKDLANTRLLNEYSEKYQDWAAEMLRSIESDYLASMTMMTKSFHDHMTPFDIAVEHELIEFLSCDRMARIGHAIWVKPDLLSPEISENSFEVRSTGLVEVVKALPHPKSFYFTPIGFNFTEKFLFLFYLAIFTAVTMLRVKVYDPLEWYDWLLFACSVGYVFNEILQFIQEGPGKYFQTWENVVDIIVSVVWILIIFLRILAVILIQSFPNLQEIELLRGIDNDDSFLNLLFTGLWVVNIVLLWIRCLHFLMLSNEEGPLINVTKSMAADVKNWLFIFFVISIGFVFGMYFLVGDTNVFFETEVRAVTLTILAAFGQPDWRHVQSGSQEELNVINSWIIVVYSIVGFVVLINLLIAMMAESYSNTEGQSAKEVLLNKVSLAYELDHAPKIMPPPFNSVLLIFFVIYEIFDVLILAFTAEFLNEQGFTKYWRCRNKECKFLNPRSVIDEHVKQGWDKDFPCGLCDQDHPMDDIYKSSKRRFRRKARGLEGDKSSCCSRLGRGFTEIFVTKTKWKKHSWLCGYCRSRLPANYSADLERYFKRLRESQNLDENDVNWIKLNHPQLCPFCYRPRRPRARPTYILENLSFIIFVVMIWPIMWFLFWPIWLYDVIVNPNRAEPDYKEFRKKHNKLYSLRPDAMTVRRHMPRSQLHQSVISLHHPIWRSLHKHRSTVKGQTLAQSIYSANLRQEKVRQQNSTEKRSKVNMISELVFDVLASMANNRITWQPTNAELMERMSAISGVNIDADWYEKHTTIRTQKAQQVKILLALEASGGKFKASGKLSARHLRGSSKGGGQESTAIIDQRLLQSVLSDDDDDDGNGRKSGRKSSRAHRQSRSSNNK